MVQGPSLEHIEQLRNPVSHEAQVSTLKGIKNDIVGHEQRKEIVVRRGLIQVLVDSISQQSCHPETRLQSVLILGSLASGGLAFLRPLLAADAVAHLVHCINGDASPRLVTAILQALRSLTSAASIDNDTQVISEVVKHLPLETFARILSRQKNNSNHYAGRQQVKLIAEITSFAAINEGTRSCIAGLLETLASLLVPPATQPVPEILCSISAIISGSNYRTQSFILSPSIRQMLANPAENGEAEPRFVPGPNHVSTGDLLPQLHVPTLKSVSFNSGTSYAFPALASLQRGAIDFAGSQSLPSADYNHANAVVGWLIYLARSLSGLERLHALRLLALVNNSIDADSSSALCYGNRSGEAVQRTKERERQMAMLAVPLAVKLVQVAIDDKQIDYVCTAAEEREHKAIQEQSCEVLALMIQGSKELQSAARDAGAIKRVPAILKHTFDSVVVAKGMWSAQSSTLDQNFDLPDSCKMGKRGLPAEVRRTLRIRETALACLAALAKKEDLHRKAIIEAGVTSCIIDALHPMDPQTAEAFEVGGKQARQSFTAADGNTISVLLAACHAAQSLSRSVSLLRTSLIDAGIAKPIFKLLTHPNRDVQIAATDVACNLLLEFSPMRDDLLAAGAIKTLTDHARQSEMGLRLASLWALKHLVLSASKDVKVNVLEELGTGWLVGAIQGSSDARDEAAGGVSIASVHGAVGGLSTPNAAGEQVDLLNPTSVASGSMDVDDEEDDGDQEEEEDDDDEDGEVMYDEAAGTHYQSSQLRSTLHPPFASASNPPGFDPRQYLSSVREQEQNSTLRNRRDDVAVQEQALDFVRNILNGEDCAFMFDHLMRAIGQDKTFSLLADKLAPLPSASTSRTSSDPRRSIYHPTELILSTVHVLTHIANSSPTHKQLLIAHPRLLNNWLPHFTHPDRRVRVICVWAVNSLTWVEDESDRQGAIQRARYLRDVGIDEVVRSLRDDQDLDVKERVRTAVRQLDSL